MKEPELYELHDRVQQIRKALDHASEREKAAITQGVIKNGASTL